MKCDEFEDRIQQVLDERQRPELDVELTAHGVLCPRCRDLAAAYRTLLDGCCTWVAPQPSDDLGARVLDSLRAEPARSPRRVAWIAAAMATAAALLVAAIPLLNRQPEAEPAPVVAQSARPAARTVSRVDAAAQLMAVPLVGPVLESINNEKSREDPYEVLAKETGQGLANVVLTLPALGGPLGFVDAQAASAGNSPAWAEPLSEGLKPITQSLSETFNLLLKIVPGTQVASRS